MPPERIHDELSPKRFPDMPPAFVIRLVLFLRQTLLTLANRLVPPEAVVSEQATGLAATVLVGFECRRLVGLRPDAVHR